MNFKKQTSIVVFTVSLALTGTVAIVSTQGSQDEQPSAKSQARAGSIVGVWRTVVTPRSCLTGAPLGSLPGLFTFHEGGTMAEYGIGPGSSPALRSPGHGVWQREHGPHDYSFAFTFYRYDANGAFIGSQKITAALRLEASGRKIATSSVIETLDADDNLIGGGCATAAATRFE